MERQEKAPNSPDIGLYLRQYVEKSVKTDAVSYDAAKAELEAAEKLASPDFFSRFPNVKPVGVMNIDHEDIRTINLDPDSGHSKKLIRSVVMADQLQERKEYVRNAVYVLLGLFVLLNLSALSNALIKRSNLQR